MTETVDVQGTAIGIGILAAAAVMVYGTVVSETVVGVDTTTIATWVFAVTLAVVSLAHAFVGHYALAGGHGGAAVGLLFVLLGTGAQVAIGLLVLVLSGAYIAVVTLRLKREATAVE
ncbi:hypothetical protein [Natronobeatus ordinarius]|uniref:hypothetical protein n=1 Tax=Natronobeatus ordinarius TaxID=2963433 RepID=UPI0020CBCE3B|nr:hypothetical protein [Natronobeatus ordinarius]